MRVRGADAENLEKHMSVIYFIVQIAADDALRLDSTLK
jgi:hypothetical protein